MILFLIFGVLSLGETGKTCHDQVIVEGRSYAELINELSIIDCTFVRFREYNGNGGILCLFMSIHLTIDYCSFINCGSSNIGGCIFVENKVDGICDIKNTCVFGCYATYQSGFGFLEYKNKSKISIAYVSVSNCEKEDTGSGCNIHLYGGDQSITNLNSSMIYGRHSTSLKICKFTSNYIKNSNIVSNQGIIDAIIVVLGSDIEEIQNIANSNLINNTQKNYATSIIFTQKVSQEISHCVFHGNLCTFLFWIDKDSELHLNNCQYNYSNHIAAGKIIERQNFVGMATTYNNPHFHTLLCHANNPSIPAATQYVATPQQSIIEAKENTIKTKIGLSKFIIFAFGFLCLIFIVFLIRREKNDGEFHNFSDSP